MGVIDVLDRQQQASVREGRRSGVNEQAGSVERQVAFGGLVDRQLDRCSRLAAVVLGDQTGAGRGP